MATSARITSYVGLLSFLLAVGCSSSPNSITPGPANGGGSGKTQSGVGSTPSSSGNGKTSIGKAIEIDASQAGQLKTTCGNSSLDTNEQCDDGNTEGGDGCTPLCQKELEWDCPTAGQPCVSTAACGDGILNTKEICDDKNNEDGDGCKGDCSAVEDGWQCRVPGKNCVPLCGDSVLTGSEKCDDSNSDSGDGCSSTCQVEKGFDCGTDLPSECKESECGNGEQEAGEGCDLGEENGLFYGVAGKGCSKTCTKEPDCRSGGKTQACAATCGDANIDKGAGEECDDGNAASGDGCSEDCKLEDGFNCEDETKPDTQKCPSDKSKDCLVLPVIYRDFDGANVNGGHPDFFYMGKNGPDGKKTICVPNANGEPATSGTNCSSTDAVDFCTELVKAELGADGKPQLNTGRSGGLTCECRFTDWDKTNVLASATTSTCTVEGDGSTRTRVGYPTPLKVQVIKDEESFKQWYNDSSEATTVKGTLELASIGNNLYQFSSSTPGAKAGAEPLTVKDDIHAIFMGDQTQLTSGFFPLEDTSREKTCNIWPYWVSGIDTASTCVAKEGGVVGSQWDPEGSYTKGTAGTGGPVFPVKGMMRNFYFTSEVRYLFRYDSKKSGTLKFFGDDDVWVFINGKLAIDLGAPHERLAGSVAVNGAKFGLEDGKTYEIVVFHADRHPRESNYQLTVFGFETTRTLCESACGNGVRTAGEECDDGDDNKDGADAYNACNTECKFGPFCGDGEINGPEDEEECDNGTENGQPYGTPDGCTTACKKVHYCGDGYIDGGFEECDGGTACDENCKAIIQNI